MSEVAFRPCQTCIPHQSKCYLYFEGLVTCCLSPRTHECEDNQTCMFHPSLAGSGVTVQERFTHEYQGIARHTDNMAQKVNCQTCIPHQSKCFAQRDWYFIAEQALCSLLCPVSAALASIFRMDLIPTYCNALPMSIRVVPISQTD